MAALLLLLLTLCIAVGLSSSRSTAEGGYLGELSAPSTARRLGADGSPINDAYVSTYKVVTSWPHDPNAFTQGLAFDAHGALYESDGIYHKSAVRQVDVQTGQHRAKTPNPTNHFGEGIAVLGERMYQLTWREGVVHEFKLPSLTHVRQVTLPCSQLAGAARCHEGWGLALGEVGGAPRLLLTDSTDRLFHLDTETLQPIGRPMQIYDKRLGRPVHGVNELEWVEGELWGNVYPMYQGTASECVVRINATDASVIGWVDFHGLFSQQRQAVRSQPHNYVLNGIAYHANSGRLYVTGKQWDRLYHVKIEPAEREAQTPAHVASVCDLGRADGRRAAG
jgi:glutamine cyclotransferase